MITYLIGITLIILGLGLLTWAYRLRRGEETERFEGWISESLSDETIDRVLTSWGAGR